MSQRLKNLIADLIILLLSCFFAFLLVQNGDLDNFIRAVTPVQFLAEFIAGMLFTSILTTPFSFALFLVLAENIDPLQIAVIGGLGACLGDMLIVSIFRNSFFDDFKTLEKTLKLKRLFHFFHHSHFNHLAPILGVLVIASPFPDELGLMLLGASKLKTIQLAILTFTINAGAIYFIVMLARYI